MGQSEDNGYEKQPAVTKQQKTVLDQILAQVIPGYQKATQGFEQFLPGGTGGEAIINQANQRFQQQTIPQILGAFGGEHKGSSALNQALAAGGANLNTDLAALLSQLSLNAAQGLSGQTTQQAAVGAGTPQFAYQQKQPSAATTWMQTLLPVLGTAAGSALGPGGALAGGALGRAAGTTVG